MKNYQIFVLIQALIIISKIFIHVSIKKREGGKSYSFYDILFGGIFSIDIIFPESSTNPKLKTLCLIGNILLVAFILNFILLYFLIK